MNAENTIRASQSIAFSEAVSRLKKLTSLLSTDKELKNIVEFKGEVLGRFQPIFRFDHLPQLTEDEFTPLLYFENNHHWSGLYRHIPKIRANIPELRNMLIDLLDESKPFEERFTNAIGAVPGMGKAIITAILQIVYPDKYGVWNNTSEAGLRVLKVWPKFEHGESIGSKYAKINEVLKELSRELNIDLWSLDSLWWAAKSDPIQEVAGPTDISAYDRDYYSSLEFKLERHLQEFLADNWEKISLNQHWSLYSENDDDDAGVEYPCDVGSIDILARHKNGKDWLVIELKRNQAIDDTLGQVLRYMGWVKAEMAKPGEKVQGMIVARKPNQKLLYALNATNDVDLQLYEVEFRLRQVSNKLGQA